MVLQALLNAYLLLFILIKRRLGFKCVLLLAVEAFDVVWLEANVWGQVALVEHALLLVLLITVLTILNWCLLVHLGVDVFDVWFIIRGSGCVSCLALATFIMAALRGRLGNRFLLVLLYLPQREVLRLWRTHVGAVQAVCSIAAESGVGWAPSPRIARRERFVSLLCIRF